MTKIEIESYGKINLSLDVVFKRQDGYHEINTIMQQISLKDTLEIEEIKGKDIIIECNKSDLPLDSRNLVYKAWAKLKEKTGIESGVKINIRKEIPIAAGLAGGSSNAASTLIALNKLWNLNLSEEELQKIGVTIGADVPYCLMGGTAHAKGIGEELTRLRSFSGKQLLLFNPGIEVASSYVYNHLKPTKSNRIDIEEIISFVEMDDLKGVAQNMKNIMEEVVLAKHPIIGEVKKTMISNGALGALMSGSGSTVFGLFDDLDKLNHCKAKLEDRLTNKGILRVSQTL